MLNPLSSIVLALTLGGCGPKSTTETAAADQATADAQAAEAPTAEAPTATPEAKTVKASEVEWAPINPEQPAGPMWVILSGNPGETEFAAMVKVPAGYSSGLHIHAATMSGVVVSGTVLNGRTEEEATELPAGSMWSQPGGEARFTGCTEAADCVFVGTMDGPIARTAVDTPADASTQIVMAATEIDYAPMDPAQPNGTAVKMIHGDRTTGPWMAFAKVPSGTTAPKPMHGGHYTGVLISGEFPHGVERAMTPGSYWTEGSGQPHITGCNEGNDCIFFISMNGAIGPVASESPADEAASEEAPTE